MASQFVSLPPQSGGGGGGADTALSNLDAVTAIPDTGLLPVNGASAPLGTVVRSWQNVAARGFTAVNSDISSTVDFWAAAGGNATYVFPSIPGAAGTVLTEDGSGNLSWAPGGSGGANQTLSNLTAPTSVNEDLLPDANNTRNLGDFGAQFLETHTRTVYSENRTAPDGDVGSFNQNTQSLAIVPDSSSPDYQTVLNNKFIELDPDATGFEIGSNGNSLIVDVTQVNANYAGVDAGAIVFSSSNFTIGNGTDPASVRGINYSQGFGQINANATITGPVIGHTFAPNFQVGSTMDVGQYLQGFTDTLVSSVELPSHTSFSAGPSIDSIANNCNYSGMQIGAQIDTFSGNSNFTGIGVFPNLGTFGTGSFSGVMINPNVDSVNYASGISVNMDNVTVSPGTYATLVIQDLTITASQYDNTYNTVTFEYTGGGTAGAEVVSGSVPNFQVQIEDGVSTATQVKAALDGFGPLATLITTSITGVGSNPQVIQSATSMSGNVNPGTKQAGYFKGDVQIDGALSFTGGLNIGALSSFASSTMTSGTGTPASIDTLITAPQVAANATLTNADLLAVNTAMLLTVGDNASVSTAFLGVTALGLPAVASLGAGAVVDRVGGAAFAISLDAAAGGGTINNVDLCRALAIPNGVTTVDRLIGYKMDLPFGDPGTVSWGLYVQPAIHNYVAGDLLIGGTPVSDDTVANSSVGLELNSTTKALLLSRMTTTERDALTALDGMLIYNTTANKFQGRENGAWVDLV